MYVKREGRPKSAASCLTSSAQCRYHSGIAVRSAMKLESAKGWKEDDVSSNERPIAKSPVCVEIISGHHVK
jgi:hypothetical protein